MNLHKCLLTENNCYKAGVKITPAGIMVHSTGANNPTLKRYVQPDDGLLGVNQNSNDWNCPKPGGVEKCTHAFIGRLKDGTVATYQTLPWDIRGWHSGYANKYSTTNANKLGYIGFEICEDGLSDPDYLATVYQEAVELTAYLCKLYGLDPTKDGVVICHSEGHKRGIASNHGDVMHWFPKHGKSMDTFRADVAAELGKADTTTFKPYVVRIRATDVRIRKGPGTNCASAGTIKPGVYTIVEEADGQGAKKWGKLKSGAGWIPLDYAPKI